MTEARKLLAEGQSESTYAQALQRLTVPVVDAVAIGKTRAIACVGVGAGHEVAVTALSLARALAAHGRKTILLDLDGHHGLIPDLLELPFAPGLADLVSGRTDFAHAIQKDHASNLQIIRRGTAQGAAADLLLNRTESITRTLAGIYEAVIVHVGEASPAALRLMRGCQAAVLIAPGQRFADLGPATESLKGQGIAQVWAIRADGFLKQAA
jgi:Mrp family chromosome partitioning ATPase